MNDQRISSSKLDYSQWDTEINVPRPLSSSLELNAPHLWTPTPEQNFAKSTAPDLPKEAFVSQSQGDQLTKGFLKNPRWAQIIPFVAVAGFTIITAVILAVVLIFTLKTPITTTSTTSTTTETTSSTTSTSTTTTASSTTTTTTSSTSTSTTTTSSCGVACTNIPSSSSARLAYYKFESNLNDVTGVYPATSVNSPTYVTGYANSAIYFDAPAYQKLVTSSMNLYNKSFTIEFWFYLTRVATQDNAFFGQQSLSNIGGQCLFLMCHSGRLYMGFFNDDTMGSTLLQSNTWYHAAFVYDNDIRQRFIYLNGILDAQSAVGVGPYLGTSGSMTIGSAYIDGTFGIPYFSGYIDELIISTRAKTSCEILNDATLAVYIPFDNSHTDAGPNSVPVTSSGTSFTSGYTNQGVVLSGSSSYFQIGGLNSLGQADYSFSIAFWIYPIVKGILVHVSQNASGRGWCTPFITFDASDRIVSGVYDPGNTIILNGPTLLYNTWTHVTQTYSPSSGQRLYINGALYTFSSASTIYSGSQTTDFITFGNMLSGAGHCANPGVSTIFQGIIDEFRVYSRELASTSVCLLAQS